MHNCNMVIGEISSKEKDHIYIWDGTDIIAVRPDSFKYGNYLYKLI